MDNTIDNILKQITDDIENSKNEPKCLKNKLPFSVLTNTNSRPESILHECIDNSIAAGAKIIKILKDTNRLIILDNGEDKYNEDRFFTGNGGRKNNKHDPNYISVASMGLCAITSNNTGKHYIITNEDNQIKVRENSFNEKLQFTQTIFVASKALTTELENAFGEFHIAIICPNLSIEKTNNNALDDSFLIGKLGVRYCEHIMNKGLEIKYNDHIIQALDPMLHDLPKGFEDIQSNYVKELCFKISIEEIINKISEDNELDEETLSDRIFEGYTNNYAVEKGFNKESFLKTTMSVESYVLPGTDDNYKNLEKEYPQYKYTNYGASYYSNGFFLQLCGIYIGKAAINKGFSVLWDRNEYNHFRGTIKANNAFARFFNINGDKETFEISSYVINIIEDRLFKNLSKIHTPGSRSTLSSLICAIKDDYADNNKKENSFEANRKNELIGRLRKIKTSELYLTKDISNEIDVQLQALDNNTADIDEVNKYVNTLEKQLEFYRKTIYDDIKNIINRIINLNFNPEVISELDIYFSAHEDESEANVVHILRSIFSKAINNENSNYNVFIRDIGIETILDYRTEKGLDHIVELTDNETNYIRKAAEGFLNNKLKGTININGFVDKLIKNTIGNNIACVEVKGILKASGGKVREKTIGHSLALCSHLICWNLISDRAKIKSIKIVAYDGTYVYKEKLCNGIYEFINHDTGHIIKFVLLRESNIFSQL